MERDLKDLLKEWRIPDPPAHLDERIVAAYSGMRRRTVWTRSVHLPAPLFALLVILQVASAVVIWRYLFVTSPTPPAISIPERVVEVPIVREKTVTQIVYLPAVPAGNSRQRAFRAAAAPENEGPPMELAGFRPVAELQLRIIKGGEQK